MKSNRLFSSALAVAVLSVFTVAAPSAMAIVAYNVPAGTVGNQAFGGALGMDFTVNDSIIIDSLGVFDSGSNGLSTPITARIFDRTRPQVAIATLVFPAGSPGTLIDGSRFLDLTVPLQLPAGFQGTIVASGYNGAEPNGNQGSVALGLTTDNGGGLISFLPTTRFGNDPNQFPFSGDGGPANRYAAGTFNFGASKATVVDVDLQNATAILSQPNFNVGQAINGNVTPSIQFNGWANSALGNNTAVFETVSDIATEHGAHLQFTLTSGGFSGHTLGRFRLSVTGDDRSEFADGLPNGGDVDANWIVLEIESIMSTNPTTLFTELGDLSILASGGQADTETYVVNATTSLANITGFRLEMLEDPSLPGSGPGRAGNSNYVLLEFAVTAQAVILPEPSSVVLLLVGGAGLVARRRRMA